MIDCVGLSHCRHLKTVRTHLTGLVHPDIILPDSPTPSGGGLTEDLWRSMSQSGEVERFLSFSRSILVLFWAWFEWAYSLVFKSLFVCVIIWQGHYLFGSVIIWQCNFLTVSFWQCYFLILSFLTFLQVSFFTFSFLPVSLWQCNFLTVSYVDSDLEVSYTDRVFLVSIIFTVIFGSVIFWQSFISFAGDWRSGDLQAYLLWWMRTQHQTSGNNYFFIVIAYYYYAFIKHHYLIT